MHIHPSSPNFISSLQSEESAAVKIQAGFRGYRVRKQLLRHHKRCSTNGYHQQHQRLQERQFKENQKEMSSQGNISNASSLHSHAEHKKSNSENNSIEDRCATKIQAGVRGFLVRKKQKIAADAATKIQASFRGFKARKETQKLKQK